MEEKRHGISWSRMPPASPAVGADFELGLPEFVPPTGQRGQDVIIVWDIQNIRVPNELEPEECMRCAGCALRAASAAHAAMQGGLHAPCDGPCALLLTLQAASSGSLGRQRVAAWQRLPLFLGDRSQRRMALPPLTRPCGSTITKDRTPVLPLPTPLVVSHARHSCHAHNSFLYDTFVAMPGPRRCAGCYGRWAAG